MRGRTRAGAPGALVLLLSAAVAACAADTPEGLALADPGARVRLVFDVFRRPLPEIPLPNDIATRRDFGSPTDMRINASMVAPTRMEGRTRELFDRLDGWGVLAPITIPFSGPIDVRDVVARHHDDDYDLRDDAVYVIDVTPGSPTFGQATALDVGNGNYPIVLEDLNGYGPNDPRGDTLNILFDEHDEDLNGDGVLQPEEDTDSDGVLDLPNYLPGARPPWDDLAARADALMGFYERETNTLVVRPLVPLQERTTYAVVVTKRLLDTDGRPVGSPYAFINHTAQSAALATLPDALARLSDDIRLDAPLSLDDVAFAWTFTTQSITGHYKAVRDGLYGVGNLAFLAEQFPAEVAGLHPLREVAPGVQIQIVPTEQWIEAYRQAAVTLFGIPEGSGNLQALLDGQRAIDFHVFGKYRAPQFMRRYDDKGDVIPLNDQSWQFDADDPDVRVHDEELTFWLMVPRKEVSPERAAGGPAPVCLFGHSYLSAKAEAFVWGGLIAQHGFAVLAVDHVGHGVGIGELELQLAKALLGPVGGGLVAEALLSDRAVDQDNDGVKDSGVDFWTAYTFHTRDNVRQSAMDMVQLTRVFRAFDGVRRWELDVDGDGVEELKGIAGDFDGDGTVDAGGDGVDYIMVGGSLGGIMSTVMGGIEPKLTLVVPVSGAGALGAQAIRSKQGGIREAVHLRIMGPMYVGYFNEDRTLRLTTVLPDLNRVGEVDLGTIEGVKEGDTVIARNLANGEVSCGRVFAHGFRVALEADHHDSLGRVREGDRMRFATREEIVTGRALQPGDPLQLEFYDGLVLLGRPDCAIRSDATPTQVINKFPNDLEFQNRPYFKDTQLTALGEGLGLRRSAPELRRALTLLELVTNPADPAVLAAYMQREEFDFTYGTGERVRTHILNMPTIGDPGVPTAGGAVISRAAGLLDFRTVDPRYGKTPNQLLIDLHVFEGVDGLKRYVDDTGRGVLQDVDNLSNSTDAVSRDGQKARRLDPPLRLVGPDALGGYSGTLFSLWKDTGEHGIPLPRAEEDTHRRRCREGCGTPPSAESPDPCGCQDLRIFDLGTYVMNLAGRYGATRAQWLDPSLECLAENTCEFIPTPPPPRQ